RTPHQLPTASGGQCLLRISPGFQSELRAPALSLQGCPAACARATQAREDRECAPTRLQLRLQPFPAPPACPPRHRTRAPARVLPTNGYDPDPGAARRVCLPASGQVSSVAPAATTSCPEASCADAPA